MEQNYLPLRASIAETCEWLKEQTGVPWTLARLLEHGLRPWIWSDYTPRWPTIFGGKIEGYLAPIMFSGDIHRLAADGQDVLINMTRSHDGTLFKMEPAMQGEIKDLRFLRDDIKRLAFGLSKSLLQETSTAAKVEDGTVTTPSDEEIRGKMPQTTIGKLAIKAALQIECSTGKQATAKQVIEKLQAWTETEPELTEIIPHGVKWATTKGRQKPFDVEACAKALETWQASRA